MVSYFTSTCPAIIPHIHLTLPLSSFGVSKEVTILLSLTNWMETLLYSQVF